MDTSEALNIIQVLIALMVIGAVVLHIAGGRGWTP